MYMGSGGMLTGKEIIRQVGAGNIHIDNFDESQVNPNSYNIPIGNTISTIKPNRIKYYGTPTSHVGIIDRSNSLEWIDPASAVNVITEEIREDGYMLMPNQLYLIPLRDKVSTDCFIQKVAGRSTMGRYGVSVYRTANFGDIGFSGIWTLQVTTVFPFLLRPYSQLAQVYFMTPVGSTEIKYHGKYQNADTVLGPKLDKTIAKPQD